MTKPFGCIDITHDKKNENVNGQEFISERVSLHSKDLLEKNSEEVNDMIKKSFLPLPLRIVKFICQFVFIASAAVIFRFIIDQGGAQLIKTMPWWFITIICVSLGGWIALALMQGKKKRQVLEGAAAEKLYEKTNNAVQCINEELNIPKTAVDVDILTFCYKKNEDKISPKARGFAPEYFNSIFSAFVEGDNLYLADLEAKYAFPLSSLCSIKRIDKRIYVPMWNKDENFNEGVYKQYKIRTNNYGWICFKPYYILELEHNGTMWGIYFPCYELKAIEDLTGLKANNQ